jgi:transposase
VKGKLREHHRFLISDLLVHLDFLDEQIAQIQDRIKAKPSQMHPFQSAVYLLDTIPGVNRLLAILIVPEVGVDLIRFPSD